MIAIIPVAGYGKRLRPHTLTKPKVLLNVAGKPMIHFIVEQLIKDKIADKIVFITGYMGDKIEAYLTGAFPRKGKTKFEFITQDDPKGLGHAIHCAKPAFNNNEEVLIVLGDTLFDVDLKKMTGKKSSVIGVKKVDDPRRFGVVEKNKKGVITRFVEKPASDKVSPSNEAIVGLYFLKDSGSLFDALDHIISKKIKSKGEFQLTDALEKMLSQGEKMTTFKVDGWLDCGKPETLLDTNKYILDNILKKSKHKVPSGCLIAEPVFIGKNVKLKNCIVGPYATINDNCEINNSIIINSIINKNCTIENSILEETILGESSNVRRESLKLNMGDFSEKSK